VGGQHHDPASVSPGKTRHPLYRRLGGPQGRSGRVRKISLPPGLDTRTIQPVASRYTDWANPAHLQNQSDPWRKGKFLKNVVACIPFQHSAIPRSPELVNMKRPLLLAFPQCRPKTSEVNGFSETSFVLARPQGAVPWRTYSKYTPPHKVHNFRNTDNIPIQKQTVGVQGDTNEAWHFWTSKSTCVISLT
jgi:hypothetical protein